MTRLSAGKIGIVGAGLAGLLLARRYIAETAATVLLFDPCRRRDNHIWGFFDDGRRSLDPARGLSVASWPIWTFSDGDKEHRLSGSKACYRAIRSAGYEAALRSALTESGRVTFVGNAVTTCDISGGKPVIEDDGHNRYDVDICYDTRPAPTPEHCMLQHFLGVTVRTPKDVFDDRQARLMDLSVTQTQGIHFMYVLPFSPTDALIESTVFSRIPLQDHWYQQHIKSYLQDRYDVHRYQILETETGIIPLFNGVADTSFGIPTGLRAGAMRASSGYAFSQIHDQISALDLTAPEHARLPSGPATWLERRMDDILLAVLTRNPALAPELFMRMAAALSADDFAAFMLGRSAGHVKAGLVLALPKWPFLREVLQ